MDMNTAGTMENDRADPLDFMSLENDGMRNKRMIKTRGYQRNKMVSDNEPNFPYLNNN